MLQLYHQNIIKMKLNKDKMIILDSLTGVEKPNLIHKNSKRRKQRQRGKLKQIKFCQVLLTPLINFWKNQDEIYKSIRENQLVNLQP